MKITIDSIKRIVVAIAMLCVINIANAADFEVDGISYNILSADDHTCAVTVSTTGYTGDIVIPASVTYGETEYSVTTIDNTAFKQNTNITSVVISNGVTTLANGVFNGCTALKELDLPESITIIPNAMCMSCSGLESVVVRGQVTEIVQYAFCKCESLSSLKIYATTPPTVGTKAFENVSEEIKIYVPSQSEEAYRSDSNWNTFAIELFDVATGVESVLTEGDAVVEYYNILGVKVANPTKGLYIKKVGNKAHKVYL